MNASRSLIITHYCWQQLLIARDREASAGRLLAGALFGTATPRRVLAEYFRLAGQSADVERDEERTRILRLRPVGQVASINDPWEVATFITEAPIHVAPGDVLLVLPAPPFPLRYGCFDLTPERHLRRIPVHRQASPFAGASRGAR